MTFFRPPIQIQIDYSPRTQLIQRVFISNMFSPALPEKTLKEYAGITGDTDFYWIEFGESPKLSYITVTPGPISDEQRRARQLRSLPSDQFKVISIRIPHSEKEKEGMALGKYDGMEFKKQLDAIQSTIVKFGLGQMSAWVCKSGGDFNGNEYVIEVLDAKEAIRVLNKALRELRLPKGTEIQQVSNPQTTDRNVETNSPGEHD